MKTGNTRRAGQVCGLRRAASMEPGHEDREYAPPRPRQPPCHQASMEPGHEDREYIQGWHRSTLIREPQWSPVMKTGNTSILAETQKSLCMPQWSPVMKTGNTRLARLHDHRAGRPQWSPVMKTGNTQRVQRRSSRGRAPQWSPVMKTGNTRPAAGNHACSARASMEPGHEDREYRRWWSPPWPRDCCLNGARS